MKINVLICFKKYHVILFGIVIGVNNLWGMITLSPNSTDSVLDLYIDNGSLLKNLVMKSRKNGNYSSVNKVQDVLRSYVGSGVLSSLSEVFLEDAKTKKFFARMVTCSLFQERAMEALCDGNMPRLRKLIICNPYILDRDIILRNYSGDYLKSLELCDYSCDCCYEYRKKIVEISNQYSRDGWEMHSKICLRCKLYKSKYIDRYPFCICLKNQIGFNRMRYSILT